MTILVDKCQECFRTCFGADLPGADETSRPAKVFARDVVCPDGHHPMDQEWTVPELIHLMESREPIFHCVTHSYRWNPDPKQLEYIRRFANAFASPGEP
jgi:hypothetical protein